LGFANIIRVNKARSMREMGNVTSRGEMENSNRLLVEKPVSERPLVRPRLR
jgi:hypothetical protein